MKQLRVYRSGSVFANIDQLPIKRDWMDATSERHAYHCFPVSLANRLGWGVSFPEDISFIWDGTVSSRPDHVKILKGHKFAHVDRGNQTISFNTGLYFEHDTNLSLLTMPVPNMFIDGATCMTTITSTSVLFHELPIAWMITRPNVEITIPANTPIAAILPISLKKTQEYEVLVKTGMPPKWKKPGWVDYMMDRSKASQEKNSVGDWTHFYRDAVDHLGESIGQHESKKIILKVNYENPKDDLSARPLSN